MLEIRPNCECCDKDLPAASEDAHICSYECTFCTNCVETILGNVCPNCGGGFRRRPIRPATTRRPGIGLDFQPASNERIQSKYTIEEIAEFAGSTKSIPPSQR